MKKGPYFLEKADYWWDIQSNNRFGTYIEGYEKMGLDKCLRLLPQSSIKTVLDFGCGSGNWSLYIQKESCCKFRVIGIDIDKEALALYKKRVPSSSSILTSPNDSSLPLEKESVDLIIVFQAPFTKNWFFKEAHRVLKHNGVLVGTLLNKTSWRGALQRIKATLWKTENPFVVSLIELKERTKSEGFEMIFSRGFGWIPVPSRQNNSLLISIFGLLEKILFLGSIKALSPNLVFILRKL